MDEFRTLDLPRFSCVISYDVAAHFLKAEVVRDGKRRQRSRVIISFMLPSQVDTMVSEPMSRSEAKSVMKETVAIITAFVKSEPADDDPDNNTFRPSLN